MLDFFVEKVLFGILVLLVLFLCFLAGGMAASEIEGGPSAVVQWACVAAVIMGAIGAFIGYIWWDIADFGKPITGAIFIGFIAVACTALLPADQYVNGHSVAVYHREQAPLVQAFALRHFDEIAIGHADTITDGMMDMAVDHANLSTEDHDLLVYMRAQQSEVGHVIDSYTTTTYVWISTGTNGGGYMSPVTTTTYIYGINRGDLESYPARVTEKYKMW